MGTNFLVIKAKITCDLTYFISGSWVELKLNKEVLLNPK